jgi:hypothetical protein
MAGGAQPGNKFGEKLKDPEVRKEAYRQYCAHLAKGKTKKSWFLKHPECTCTYQTIEGYFKEYPHEFDLLKRDSAYAEGLGVWEQHVENAALGENEKANTASLQMAMRNKFGWDKEDRSKETIDESKLGLLEKFFKSVGSSKSPEAEQE